ncbi:MAG: hypothetical protein LBM94_03245 [Propionibacteriaceae bacterium]|nr:hypothetical protein [Propionibacteriaceae bacterium]
MTAFDLLSLVNEIQTAYCDWHYKVKHPQDTLEPLPNNVDKLCLDSVSALGRLWFNLLQDGMKAIQQRRTEHIYPLNPDGVLRSIRVEFDTRTLVDAIRTWQCEVLGIARDALDENHPLPPTILLPLGWSRKRLFDELAVTRTLTSGDVAVPHLTRAQNAALSFSLMYHIAAKDSPTKEIRIDSESGSTTYKATNVTLTSSHNRALLWLFNVCRFFPNRRDDAIVSANRRSLVAEDMASTREQLRDPKRRSELLRRLQQGLPKSMEECSISQQRIAVWKLAREERSNLKARVDNGPNYQPLSATRMDNNLSIMLAQPPLWRGFRGWSANEELDSEVSDYIFAARHGEVGLTTSWDAAQQETPSRPAARSFAGLYQQDKIFRDILFALIDGQEAAGSSPDEPTDFADYLRKFTTNHVVTVPVHTAELFKDGVFLADTVAFEYRINTGPNADTLNARIFETATLKDPLAAVDDGWCKRALHWTHKKLTIFATKYLLQVDTPMQILIDKETEAAYEHLFIHLPPSQQFSEAPTITPSQESLRVGDNYPKEDRELPSFPPSVKRGTRFFLFDRKKENDDLAHLKQNTYYTVENQLCHIRRYVESGSDYTYRLPIGLKFNSNDYVMLATIAWWLVGVLAYAWACPNYRGFYDEPNSALFSFLFVGPLAATLVISFRETHSIADPKRDFTHFLLRTYVCNAVTMISVVLQDVHPWHDFLSWQPTCTWTMLDAFIFVSAVRDIFLIVVLIFAIRKSIRSRNRIDDLHNNTFRFRDDLPIT